jgi:hypothetical protein
VVLGKKESSRNPGVHSLTYCFYGVGAVLTRKSTRKTLSFAPQTTRFERRSLAVSLILQQLAGETPGFLLLSVIRVRATVRKKEEKA